MKKCKIALILGALIMLMTACPVEVEPKAPDETTSDSRQYQISFKVNGEQFIITGEDDLKSLGYYDSKYIKNWYDMKMGSYRGPLLSYKALKNIENDTVTIGSAVNTRSYKSTNKRVELRYLKEVNSIVLDLYYDTADYIISVQTGFSPGTLSLVKNGDELTAIVPATSTFIGTKEYKHGMFKENVVISDIKIKGKIISSLQEKWQLYLSNKGIIQDCAFEERVANTKSLRIRFDKVRAIGGGIESFTTITDMNRANNYIYINDNKVYGTWESDGTFVYTPATPYSLTEKVKVVIPETFVDQSGHSLEYPVYLFFNSGSSAISSPLLRTDMRHWSIESPQLGWIVDGYEGIDSYVVYRADSKMGDYKAIYTEKILDPITSLFNTGYVDYSTIPGQSYFYKVKAMSGTEESEFSNIVEIAGLKKYTEQIGTPISWNFDIMNEAGRCYSFQVQKQKYSVEIENIDSGQGYLATEMYVNIYSGNSRLVAEVVKGKAIFAVEPTSSELTVIVKNISSLKQKPQYRLKVTEVTQPAAQ